MASIKTIFTNIANAIRTKKGTSAKYLPENMAEEISTIETGITPSGKIEITNTEEINVTNYETAQIVDSNLLAENIKEGVSILGKVGTFKGSSENTLKKLLDTTKSTYRLFNDYTGTSVDDLIKYDDTENVTKMSEMFYNSKVRTIPLLNTSNVIYMDYMFAKSSIQIISNLDISKVQNMNSAFESSAITEISLDNDTYQMGRTFMNCSKLTSINISNSNKLIQATSMCSGCSNLITLAQINMIYTTEAYNMFYNCKALTNLTLLNIKVNLQIGSGTSWGHLLTLDSLINTIKELVNVGASRTLTMGSANLEKIANVYVRRTTTGDIPTCLSDNSNIDLAKGPCEVCESTDEGAMLITAYANSKNWTLA